MFTYKLLLAYDGTNYCGWQAQREGLSIQETLEKSLEQFLREKIRLHGSGRTDAGVHAKGQTAHFRLSKELDEGRFMAAANGLLPRDIRVQSIERAAEDFHARYSAIGKVYHYHLHLDPVIDPFKRLYATHIRGPIDFELLERAAALFVGTKDFTSYSNSPCEGAAAKNPVRTLSRCQVLREEGGCRIELEADGFLYKMARNLVGMCLDVARGKRRLEEIPSVFASRDRRLAAPAAPPQGLFLVKVLYP